MVSKNIVIKNVMGIHARPAGVLAKEAMKCKSDVIILKGDKVIQAKRVLNLMSAAIKCNDEIVLQCNGENEEEDLMTLATLIESGLGEE